MRSSHRFPLLTIARPLAAPGALALGALALSTSAAAEPVRTVAIDTIEYRTEAVPDSIDARPPGPEEAPAPETPGSDDQTNPIESEYDAHRDDIVPLSPYDVFDDDRSADESLEEIPGEATEGERGREITESPAVRVFPNPSLGAVTIEAGSNHLLVEVYDAAGRRVASEEGSTGRASWDGRDGAGRTVAPGVYFARVSEEAGVSRTVRIVRR